MEIKKDAIDNISPVEEQTGALFGGLWAELSREQYLQSVKLFEKRLRANNFDPGYFKGKKC